MGEKIGWLGERLCFGVGALFALAIVLQAGATALGGGPLQGALALLGLGGAGALLALGLRFLKPARAFPLALFALRLALALGVVSLFGGQPVQDFKTLYQAACQLAQGSNAYLELDYFYNWAYQTGFVAYQALVIRVFGEGQLALQVLNALWMAGSGCLVYAIGRRFLGEQAAMGASLLYALYPAPYFLSGVLTNQHIGLFFFYLGFWLLVRRERPAPWEAVLAGVSLAVGNVMRPIGAVVVLALLCWSVVRLLRWKGPGALRTGAPLLAAGVAYFICGEAFGWLVRRTGLNPEGLGNNLPLWKFVLGLNWESGGAWNQADYNAYYLLPREEAPAAMAQAVEERLGQLGPWGLLRLFWRKIGSLWGTEEYLYWGFGHLDGSAPVLGGVTLSQCLQGVNCLNQGVFLLAFLLAGAALVGWLLGGAGEGARVPVLLGALVCGYCAVHLLIEVQPRYRYFLMPAVFLLAGDGAQRLWARWGARRKNALDLKGA